MVTLFTITICVLVLFFNKFIYEKFINPLTIYTFSWSLFVILYDLHLMEYPELKGITWVIMFLSFVSFFLGIITVFMARSAKNKDNKIFKRKITVSFPILLDGGKSLRLFVWFCSILGLFAAFFHWWELIQKFGSIGGVLLNMNTIYSMRVSGGFSGSLPYMHAFAYIGVFYVAIYTAYYEKFHSFFVLPMVAVVLKDIATVGRANILFGFLLFFLVFFTMRHAMGRNLIKSKVNSRSLIIAAIVIAGIAIAAVSIVKSNRGIVENFNASSRTLNKFKKSLFISPSMYMYFSSNPAVLNRYFITEEENLRFGENTFFTVYNFVAKTGAIEAPKIFGKGYYIPMWTNQATYLREINADFSYPGLFIVPYLLGMLVTFYWFRFHETLKMGNLVMLTTLNVIVSFTVLVMITRMGILWVTVLGIAFFNPFVEKISTHYYNKQKKIN